MTRLAKVTIAACLLLAACGDIGANLKDFSTRIDTAFGITPSARYDLLTDGDVKLAVARLTVGVNPSSAMSGRLPVGKNFFGQ